MSGKLINGLENLRDKLRESKLPELAEVILEETPLGKIGRIIKGASDILGTKDDPDAVAAALEGATPEQRIALLELAAREAEAREETARNGEDNLTARHAADMRSDSWLSKNVRPIVLLTAFLSAVTYHFILLFLLAFVEIIVADRLVSMVDLGNNLKDLALWSGGFYFSWRGGEKIASVSPWGKRRAGL